MLNRDTGDSLRLSFNKGIDEIDSDFAKVRDKAFSESASPEDKRDLKNIRIRFHQRFWNV